MMDIIETGTEFIVKRGYVRFHGKNGTSLGAGQIRDGQMVKAIDGRLSYLAGEYCISVEKITIDRFDQEHKVICICFPLRYLSLNSEIVNAQRLKAAHEHADRAALEGITS